MYEQVAIINGIKISKEYESLENMEADPVIHGETSSEGSNPIPIIIEEYEDGKFLRSYEYSDPTRSTEATPVFDRKSGLHISVYINTRDEHGSLDNNSSPAHVHVFNSSGIEVGEVNINGNCPRNGQDVVMYRTKNLKAFNLCKSDIAIWANTEFIPKKLNKRITGWEFAKYEWKRLTGLGIIK
jgi:hypothetical protein